MAGRAAPGGPPRCVAPGDRGRRAARAPRLPRNCGIARHVNTPVRRRTFGGVPPVGCPSRQAPGSRDPRLPCSRRAPRPGPVVAAGSDVAVRDAVGPRGVNIMCDSARTERCWPAARGGCRSSASAPFPIGTRDRVASAPGKISPAYPVSSAMMGTCLVRTSRARSSSSSTVFPMTTPAGRTCSTLAGRWASAVPAVGAGRPRRCLGGCCGSARPVDTRSR